MGPHKSTVMTVALACSAMMAVTTYAATEEATKAVATVDIKHTVHMNRPVTPEILGKRIYIDVQKSPKLSKAFTERLASLGYKVAATENEADLKVRVYGFVFVGKAGGGSVARAQFHELVDQAASIDESQVGGYGSPSLVGAVASDASLKAFGASLSRIIPNSSILNWLSAQSGIAGAFNKALTGDPRGICLASDCTSFKTQTTVALTSSGSVDSAPNWRIETLATSDKMITDQVIVSAFEAVMKPFEDAAAKPAVAQK